MYRSVEQSGESTVCGLGCRYVAMPWNGRKIAPGIGRAEAAAVSVLQVQIPHETGFYVVLFVASLLPTCCSFVSTFFFLRCFYVVFTTPLSCCLWFLLLGALVWVCMVGHFQGVCSAPRQYAFCAHLRKWEKWAKMEKKK